MTHQNHFNKRANENKNKNKNKNNNNVSVRSRTSSLSNKKSKIKQDKEVQKHLQKNFSANSISEFSSLPENLIFLGKTIAKYSFRKPQVFNQNEAISY
ncbi:hypothetical protein M0811_14492 [Anaeramoeba ignava]|uniref:Uncharacterized protein n=1 Tax=Anaeramoeba ignava TaxID=1746090 RepID=A0A9Q0LUX1_ANAIG|nr:hypothetical protein M0811_14492 [Anaeramoeba ignava]